MANVFIEESTMQAIGNAIREKTGKSEGILPSDMPTAIESISSSGNNSIDYDLFWDNFQNYGEPLIYQATFGYDRFDMNTYNPKYPIICASGNAAARSIFYNNTKITDTKVPIDVTAITTGTVLQYTFACYPASFKSKLETITELRVTEVTDYPSTFMNAIALKNITIVGPIINEETGERMASPIGKSIGFPQSSNLSKASIIGIINGLSPNVTGQTCTFKKAAVNAAFGSTSAQEWTDLVASKPNWTIAAS